MLLSKGICRSIICKNTGNIHSLSTKIRERQHQKWKQKKEEKQNQKCDIYVPSAFQYESFVRKCKLFVWLKTMGLPPWSSYPWSPPPPPRHGCKKVIICKILPQPSFLYIFSTATMRFLLSPAQVASILFLGSPLCLHRGDEAQPLNSY